MYNRNQNVISHILQTPVEPKSRNVLWDDGTNIKIWRKSGWTSIMGGGTSVEGGEVVSIGGYPIEISTIREGQTLVYKDSKWKNSKLLLSDLYDLAVDNPSDGALLTYDSEDSEWKSINRSYLLESLGWKLITNEETNQNILTTQYATTISNNLIVTGEVASYGTGQNIPDIGGGTGVSYLKNLQDVNVSTSLSKDDLLKYDGNKWVNIAQNELKAGKLGEMGSHKDAYTPAAFNSITWYATEGNGFSGYKSPYGTSLWISHRQGYDTNCWYNRLDFATNNGGIHHWSAENSSTLHYRGQLAYITSTVFAANKIAVNGVNYLWVDSTNKKVYANSFNVPSDAVVGGGGFGFYGNAKDYGLTAEKTTEAALLQIGGYHGIRVYTAVGYGLYPYADNKLILGSPGYRWENVYSYNGNFLGNIYADNIIVTGDVASK